MADKKKENKRRTQVKDIPKKEKGLSKDEQKKVRGGTSENQTPQYGPGGMRSM